MRFWEERERRTSALDIVSMSPPSYPSAWLHPCRARLRFTWRSHCSSAPSISLNFRIAQHTPTKGQWPLIGPEHMARSRSIVPLPLAVCHERSSFPRNHLAAVAVSQAYTLGEDL